MTHNCRRTQVPTPRSLKGVRMTQSKLFLAAAALALAAAPAANAHGRHAPVKLIAPKDSGQEGGERRWLAGDHHVHSHYSADYEPGPDPKQPKVIIGGDSSHTIPLNAQKAKGYGLSWMVATDHGGPTHSKVAYDQAYPELVRSRAEFPDLLQFYGMEFDTPGADHSSLIVPHTPQEREALRGIESRFSKREPWPADPSWDAEPRMLEALRAMKDLPAPPVVIANHPSRSAKGVGEYGQTTPRELRDWNDTAPNVSVGMEGAPGHQANALSSDAERKTEGARGSYERSPTMGGFDQMTARLGGFWDSMLGEGRRWWITSTSDSHRHYSEGGGDFWPGEYSKTYVLAAKTYDDVLDGLRNGRVFVTTGDLVSQADLMVASGGRRAQIGGELAVRKGQDVTVTIRVRDPAGANSAGRKPEVARIDLIVGNIVGPAADRSLDRNPTTRVERRFLASDWKREGEVITVTYTLKGLLRDQYVRLRGTNTSDLEPGADPAGEDPWSDLWFYTNPIFIKISDS